MATLMSSFWMAHSQWACVLLCESQKACGAVLRVSDVHSVVGLSVSAAYCHLGQLHTVRHRRLIKRANYYTPHPPIFMCQPALHILSFLFFISPSREKGSVDSLFSWKFRLVPLWKCSPLIWSWWWERSHFSIPYLSPTWLVLYSLCHYEPCCYGFRY